MFKKIMTTGAVAAASLLMVVGGSSAAMAAGPNLVENGSFDASGYEAVDGKYGAGSNFGGWEIATEPNIGGKHAAFQIWYEGMPEPGATNAAPFPSGPWARLMVPVSQTIPTEVGKTYQLEFQSRAAGIDAGGNGHGWGGDNEGYAAVDGVQVSSFTTTVDPLYTSHSVTFTATSTSTVLEFSPVLDQPSGTAVGLDNVSVTEVPIDDSPLMAPAIAGGIGLAALAGGSALAISRKNKRSDK